MTKPVETGANDGRCTLGGDCPIATNPHYHQTVPIVETGSKAQAECWTCTYSAPDLHNLGATRHEVPLDLRFERGPESPEYHKALNHDVRRLRGARK